MGSSPGTFFGSRHVNFHARLRGMGYAVAAVEVGVLAWLAATEGIADVQWLAVGIAGAVGLAVAVATSWPLGAILTLVIASAMPRLAGIVGGLHLRPEHVAIAAISIGIMVQSGAQGGHFSKLRWLDYFLIAYIALNFFSSAFTSPEPRLTLRWAILNAIVIAPFFLLRFLLTDLKRAYYAVEVVLWVGAVESVFGIVCFLSNLVFKTNFGVTSDQYGFIPGVYGTQYEANIFGSYCGCCAILFLVFFLLSRGPGRGRYIFGMSLCLLAALISLARSVLLALPVAAVFVLWVVHKSGRVQFRSLVRVALVVGILALIASPFVANLVIERFSTLDFEELSADAPTLTRLVQTAVALEDIRAHPLLGTGTDSFQLSFDWDDYLPGLKGETEAGGWIGNTPLRILHDTGLMGLILFMAFLVSLASATRKAFRKADSKLKTVLLALSGGLILYAITFQATEATMLAFTWIHLGILASVVEIVNRQASSSADSRHEVSLN